MTDGYISPPKPMPYFIRAMLAIVERRLGKRLVANRILAWYPKAFWGSGIMEGLVAHDEPEVPKRLLKLLRVYVSFLVSCPFCIDLNAKEYKEDGLGDDRSSPCEGSRASTRSPASAIPSAPPSITRVARHRPPSRSLRR